jgi:lipoprotein-anchoring transpeptidase ErfK/SrfK
LQEFIDQGLTIKDRSAVDYIYFGNQTTTNYRINGTPSWFKLDDKHLSVYEAEDLVI